MLFYFLACKGCNDDQLIIQEKIQDTEEPILEEGYNNNWGSWLSLATSPQALPAASYYDKTATGLGFALANKAEDESWSWTHYEVDGYINEQGLDVGDRGKYSSLTIDASGTVWIAYYDVALKNLKYATTSLSAEDSSEENMTWTTGNADVGGGPSPDAGLYASIALKDGSPQIAHYDRGKEQLRITYYNGSSFTGEVVDRGETAEGEAHNVGKFASLAIGSDGTEYITYYDETNGNLKLAYGEAGSWNLEVIDTGDVENIDEETGETTYTSGNVGQWSDIAIAPDGTLFVSYHDVLNQNLMLAQGVPGDWSIEIVDDSELVGADTAISIEAGYTVIAYFDGQNNDFKLAKDTGSLWEISTPSGSAGATGFHNELLFIGGRYYAGCYSHTDQAVWFDNID